MKTTKEERDNWKHSIDKDEVPLQPHLYYNILCAIDDIEELEQRIRKYEDVEGVNGVKSVSKCKQCLRPLRRENK